MARGGISTLTETQIQVLRLVRLNYSSKLIARKLGSSPHTIDNHIKAAILRLGVSSRFEAARLLNDHESAPDPRRTLANQGSVLDEPIAIAANQHTPSDNAYYAEGVSEHDGAAVIRLAVAPNGGSDRRLIPLPRYWGEKNQLPAPERILRILWITALTGLAFGGVMASLRALSDLL